jgi:DNA-binding MarR family transcriptional regulator
MPLSALLSPVLVAFTIELDNEFERGLAATGLRARVTSFVMWSNFLRFVGDGIEVGDLPDVAGLPKARLLSTLGGMERWGYVTVGPQSGSRREGYGSARGLRGDWVVRPTEAGRAAAETWQPLPREIERRWEDRMGVDAVRELQGSLRLVVDGLDVELPEYLPIVGSTNGMFAEVSPAGPQLPADDHLPALLSHALLAYTLEVEQRAELSLPLGENVVRVLDEDGTAVKELPLAAGVSNEAVSMALTSLRKSGHAVVESKVVRLTPKGRQARERSARAHEEVERAWLERFGDEAIVRLRAVLQILLDPPSLLARGLEPPPNGWRATKQYLEHTNAVLADPVAALPRYPMVLHRGGWPDGS